MDNEIQALLDINIKRIAPIADALPGVVIINLLCDLRPVWMSNNGLQQLNLTLEQLQNLSVDAYKKNYFNEEDWKEYASKIAALINENNDEKIYTFFQQVRINKHQEWTWHLSSMRILARNSIGNPVLTITMACPMDAMHHMAAKANKLLEENNFLRKNIQYFKLLTPREKEILKLLALGKSSAEISKDLFIALFTVDTHRRNIRKKLNNASSYELSKYASAFDLI